MIRNDKFTKVLLNKERSSNDDLQKGNISLSFIKACRRALGHYINLMKDRGLLGGTIEAIKKLRIKFRAKVTGSECPKIKYPKTRISLIVLGRKERNYIDPLIEESWKYLKENKLQVTLNCLESIKDNDLIVLVIDSCIVGQLPAEVKDAVVKSNLPVIVLEYLEQSITLYREYYEIPNLVAVYKSFVVRPAVLNNANQFLGGYHWGLIREDYEKERGPVLEEKKPKPISASNLAKIKCLLWDFDKVHFKTAASYFANRKWKLDRPRKYDVFCANNHNDPFIQGWHKRKGAEIVDSLKDLKVVTSLHKHLEKKDYDQKFADSKVCVACWGYGEKVDMDYYAMYCGVVLIKPDSDHVETDPDIYQSGKTYVKCRPDLSDLEFKIRHVLENWPDYKEMIKRANKMITEHSKKYYMKKFWDTVLTHAVEIK